MTGRAKDFLPGSAFEPRRTPQTALDLRERPDLNPATNPAEPRRTPQTANLNPAEPRRSAGFKRSSSPLFPQVNGPLRGSAGFAGFISPLAPRTATTRPVQAPRGAADAHTNSALNRAEEHHPQPTNQPHCPSVDSPTNPTTSEGDPTMTKPTQTETRTPVMSGHVAVPGSVGQLGRFIPGPKAGRATYTVEEIAELLGLSRASAYVLLKSGDIPARRLGTRWIIPRHRFHQWLDSDPIAHATSEGGVR
jgi:excisionase family DNA binding protein